jgi:hypothetical protein
LPARFLNAGGACLGAAPGWETGGETIKELTLKVLLNYGGFEDLDVQMGVLSLVLLVL